MMQDALKSLYNTIKNNKIPINTILDELVGPDPVL